MARDLRQGKTRQECTQQSLHWIPAFVSFKTKPNLPSFDRMIDAIAPVDGDAVLRDDMVPSIGEIGVLEGRADLTAIAELVARAIDLSPQLGIDRAVSPQVLRAARIVILVEALVAVVRQWDDLNVVQCLSGVTGSCPGIGTEKHTRTSKKTDLPARLGGIVSHNRQIVEVELSAASSKGDRSRYHSSGLGRC